MLLINKDKPKDVNMEPVGHGNIKVLTDYVQNISLDIAADITKYVQKNLRESIRCVGIRNVVRREEIITFKCTSHTSNIKT